MNSEQNIERIFRRAASGYPSGVDERSRDHVAALASAARVVLSWLKDAHACGVASFEANAEPSPTREIAKRIPLNADQIFADLHKIRNPQFENMTTVEILDKVRTRVNNKFEDEAVDKESFYDLPFLVNVLDLALPVLRQLGADGNAHRKTGVPPEFMPEEIGVTSSGLEAAVKLFDQLRTLPPGVFAGNRGAVYDTTLFHHSIR